VSAFRGLQVVMPMAGFGTRFARTGVTTPKPLIPVDGGPMFEKALSSFEPMTVPVRLFAVIRRELEETAGLATALQKGRPDAVVKQLPAPTRGAVETCLAVADDLDPALPVAVLDCDLWFDSAAYFAHVAALVAGTARESGVLTFASRDPRYSYALVSDDGRVTRTAEKDPISDRALAGSYLFARGDLFVEAARELTATQTLDGRVPELYTSLLYNILLRRGFGVRAFPVDRYASFGTPEELAAIVER
jgi:NDP-sugar pyrophosphorylase family protein